MTIVGLNGFVSFMPSQVGFGGDAAAPKVEVVTPATDGRGDAKSNGVVTNGHTPAAAEEDEEEEEDDIDIDDI